MNGKEVVPALAGGDQQVGDAQRQAGATATAAKPPLSTAEPTNPPPRQYRVITCIMGVITYAYLTAQQVLELNVSDVDLSWDQVFGRISIRKPNGKRLEYRWRFPRLGATVGIPLLLDLMWAGAPLTVSDLIKSPKLRTLSCPDVRASRLYALRQAFGDSAADSRYFICLIQPYRVGWVLERSWRIIEKYTFPSVGAGQPL